MDPEILNEAYERFRGTEPEWSEDQLTNHGPMSVEVLVRRGHEGQVDRWVDGYIRRLEDLPGATGEITEHSWPEALGEGRRVGDWTEFFARRPPPLTCPGGAGTAPVDPPGRRRTCPADPRAGGPANPRWW